MLELLAASAPPPLAAKGDLSLPLGVGTGLSLSKKAPAGRDGSSADNSVFSMLSSFGAKAASSFSAQAEQHARGARPIAAAWARIRSFSGSSGSMLMRIKAAGPVAEGLVVGPDEDAGVGRADLCAAAPKGLQKMVTNDMGVSLACVVAKVRYNLMCVAAGTLPLLEGRTTCSHES